MDICHLQKISAHLEQDINRTIRRVIKNACNHNCSVEYSLITDGEYSCRTSTSCVIYRYAVMYNDLLRNFSATVKMYGYSIKLYILLQNI